MRKKLTEEEKKLRVKEKYLWKNYGLTLEEHSELVKDGCVICHKTDGRICVDHIHVLGYKKMKPEEKKQYVRAALCFYCNTALKVFERTKDGKRNRQLLNGVYKYFQTYKLKGEE